MVRWLVCWFYLGSLSLNLSLHICYPNEFFHADTGIVPCIRLLLLPSTSFPIHYSLISLSYNFFSLFCYFMILSVLRLYSVNVRITNEFGGVGGMISARGNWSTWRKPSTVPFCLPQILHDLTWDWTWAAAVGKPVANHLNRGTA
jgi:hypothetical protein